MDEKDCLILQYLLKDQNLTKAAERLYMTQPALTYRVRQIEKEFQTEILSKNGKNIKMTPAGEYLAGYANKLLIDLREAKEYVGNMGIEAKGSLKLGISSHFGLYNLPSILEDYMNNFPMVTLNVDTGFSTEMMELLMQGEIDVAIVKGDYAWFDEKYLLAEENICIISKEEIPIGRLPELPMINRKEPNVLLKYRNISQIPSEKSIDHWWNERFTSPPLMMMQVDSYETCREMVKRGLGYAIIPRVFLQETDNLFAHDLIFNNGEELKRRTWMLYRRSSLQLASVSQFVSGIKKIF
ncbi:LysR family transcriptional regulator [Peribacillus muralis]|uniref:LysR family transcriptional regulator n=1 Tax=Peribacillus muralis TaxID=264697 RepID=UPI001F4DACD9|nr:LysR family transcriptional regulator [Peribacillus muralis]MCK1992270.1 LysR family transcriptional regulator [Peribacillus muralis]MCK2012826.1 LysR family transcriptional regulator [Peribacillus muralis]